MIKIQDLSLFNLIAENLSSDEGVSALLNAVDNQLREITSGVKENIFLPRIDELSEELVDLLAAQMHVDFYKPLGLDIEKKRELVKKSLIAHRYKGTKYAMELVLQTLYGSNVSVVPWFVYGGQPYHFKIKIIIDEFNNKTDLKKMFSAVDYYKSARDTTDDLNYAFQSEAPIYTGALFCVRNKITVGAKEG